MTGLYFHIPFCKQACHYCDFHFSTSLKLKDQIIESMLREMEERCASVTDLTWNSAYFGGGTPSLLAPKDIGLLLEKARSLGSSASGLECTIECNPDDITTEKLHSWRESGINRLSIGIQSFDDRDLQFMNRAHDSKEARRSVELAKEAGFDNITIDLIFGIPESNLTAWKANLEEARKMGIQHLSCYNLTIEPKTVFGNWHKKGKLHEIDDDIAAAQFLEAHYFLEDLGYHHYEISNYGLPNYESKHNSSYWAGIPFIGIGPSAHSFDGTSRRWNVSNNSLYTKGIELRDKSWYSEEELSEADKFNEYIMTGLRTSSGLDLNYIRDEFNIDLQKGHLKLIQELSSGGLVNISDTTFKLSVPGMLQADRIASEFFIIDM